MFSRFYSSLQSIRSVWVLGLTIAVAISTAGIYRRAGGWVEFPWACDPGGYLMAAHDFRDAWKEHRLPKIYQDAPQYRVMIDALSRTSFDVAKWRLAIGPHAAYYHPETEKITIQYPPGTGLLLSFFPEGKAVRYLNRTTLAVLLAVSLFYWAPALRRRRWLAAGGLALAMLVAVDTVRRMGDTSYSINAIILPLTLSLFFVEQAATRKKNRGRWLLAGGAFLGLAFSVRVATAFLIPGIFVWTWALYRSFPWRWLLGLVFFGALPVSLYQRFGTGGWTKLTYSGNDTLGPSFDIISRNWGYYFKVGADGEFHTHHLVLLVLSALGIAVISGGQGKSKRFRFQTFGAIFGLFLTAALPAAYFLTHLILIPYYMIPSNLALIFMAALWVSTQEKSFEDVEVTFSPKGQRWRKWTMWVAALLPGLIALRWLLATEFLRREPFHTSHPPIDESKPFQLPKEILEDEAWVWINMLSSTVWHYGQKPVFKVTLLEPPIRKYVYQVAFDRGGKQYFVADNVAFNVDDQSLINEIIQWGGTLELRGKIGNYRYYQVHWARRPDEVPKNQGKISPKTR